jgi:hypothetical protein
VSDTEYESVVVATSNQIVFICANKYKLIVWMKARTKSFYEEVASEFASNLLECLDATNSIGTLQKIILKTDW